MKRQKRTIQSTIENFFESNEKKNLDEIYEYVLECGFEDKGVVTRHTIRGIIHKLNKTEKIIHLSKGVYIKTPKIT